MGKSKQDLLNARLNAESRRKLDAIKNTSVHAFIAESAALCDPDEVFICDDSEKDLALIRDRAVELHEETPLATAGHTVHFDGMNDQGRDREVTKYLVPKDHHLPAALNQIERKEGLAEVQGFLKGSMKGRTMIVRFLTLGPTDSIFTIRCVQCTDSYYVAHSEELLYRPGYDQFIKAGESNDYFSFLHSSGKLDANIVSAEPDKKRIYMDYLHDKIYSVNTQYAGNTVGLKKLALRLTIRKADREGWLAEHMFLMGVRGPNGRKTYFAGAFPSACGKTSTAMLEGETIMGDDLAYLRSIDGKARSVNAERGIFGIIGNVNPKDDPAIYDVLAKPGEVIFSNVLVKDGRPYWTGMGQELPKEGVNFSGQWHEGKKDSDGKSIPGSHKNARYTVKLNRLANVDPELDNPNGVEVGGIVYGGRDAHTLVPVQQSFDWAHGIVTFGASCETETTFATIGKEGVPEINIMSIQDFLAIPLGKYIQNNLDFAGKVKNPPAIFGVNYFLRNKEGKFLNGIKDKAVWMKWMELRAHNDVDAIRTPTGFIPRYEDLAPLFKQVLGKEYTPEAYEEQFTLRIPENLARLDRVEAFHKAETQNAPAQLAEILDAQRQRLLAAQKEYGDYVKPGMWK